VDGHAAELGGDATRLGNDSTLLPHERERPWLTAAGVRNAYHHYLPADANPLEPGISPLHAADHAGLPATTIVVAGHDPLHDEGARYAERLQQADVPVDLFDYARMVHGFANVPHLFRETAVALGEVVTAQRRYLGS
jgi:acetyl esterase